MIQTSCSFRKSDSGSWVVDTPENQPDFEFSVQRFLLFDVVRFGPLKGVAYEPLSGVLLSLLFRVFGNWILDSGIRRYYLIRVPNHGRIGLYLADFDVSEPHAKLFTYTEGGIQSFAGLAARYASFLTHL